MSTSTVNIKSVSEWWCLYVLSNTQAIFEAQFMIAIHVVYKKNQLLPSSTIPLVWVFTNTYAIVILPMCFYVPIKTCRHHLLP